MPWLRKGMAGAEVTAAGVVVCERDGSAIGVWKGQVAEREGVCV